MTVYRGVLTSLKGGVPLYRGVLTPGGWNRGVTLYTEVSSSLYTVEPNPTPGICSHSIPFSCDVVESYNPTIFRSVSLAPYHS